MEDKEFHISEPDLREYIFNNYKEIFKDIKIFQDTDIGMNQFLIIKEKIYKEVNLKSYGNADLIYIRDYKYTNIERVKKEIWIIELKNDPLKAIDFAQVCRYASGIKKLDITHGIDVHIVLLGNGLDKDSCWLVNELLYNINVITYTLKISCGIRFKLEEGGYVKEDLTMVDFEKFESN